MKKTTLGLWEEGKKINKSKLSWSDGYPMEYTNWASQPKSGDNVCVVMNRIFFQPGKWRDTYCEFKNAYVCQTNHIAIKGNTSRFLRYSKEQLVSIPTFEVWYHYKYNSKKLSETTNNKKITGFQLSWKIENPLLKLTSTEIGRSIETPGLGLSSANNIYKITLLFPSDLVEQVGNGSLVIQLGVDMRKEEGWQEEVVYLETPKWGTSRYNLWTSGRVDENEYESFKTWEDAKKQCRMEGGQLASVLNKNDHDKLKTVAEGKRMWLGGADQDKEGVWKWVDGTPWGYSKWDKVYGKEETNKNCLMIRYGVLRDDNCASKNLFVCQKDPILIK